ncbi:hypothetical protein [Streptomyces sp. NPDC002644]
MKRTWATVAAAVLAFVPVACAPRTPDADAEGLLERRSEALLDGDRAAFAATGDGGAWESLRALGPAAWRYRVTGTSGQGGDTTTVEAELRYRLRQDRGTATAHRVLTLSRDGGDGEGGAWRVVSDRPAPGTPEQLWDGDTPLRGADSARSRVLAAGDTDPRDWTRLGDEAARAVAEAWDVDVHPLVVVPESTEAMARLLGAPAATYRRTAAVTTPGAAPRVVVNPEAFATLDASARQIVVTHETTHVALRSSTTARTPMWLSEGCADWTAFRGGERESDVARAAPALARAVRDGRVPRRLPTDEEFAFGGDAETVGRAYEGAWLACRLVADRWGERAVRALHDAAGAEGEEAALREVLGVDRARFTEFWRAALRTELADA